MKNELDKIIDSLKEVIKLKNLNVSDDVLFTNACSFLRGQYASNPKTESKPTPPTEKQIKFLKDNGYDGEMPKTKQEATKIIGDALRK